MQTTKQKAIREARDIFIFILLGMANTFIMCSTCRNDLRNFTLIASFSASMWFFLWKGNDLLAHYLSNRIPWLEFPVKRLIFGIITTVVYTVLAVVGLITFFRDVLNVNVGNAQWVVYLSIAITIIISLVLHSRAFLQAWRTAKIDAERFQKESISAKYESLKNQVNPHFLFNSLNALTNLVYEDQDKAVKFIKQLSDVYRYVLDTRDREIVALEEEIKFLQSYAYLQQIRFGSKLKIDIQLNGTHSLVAPLSLQMLIENAIKHNIVSEEHPLLIKIFSDNTYLTVENTLQKKVGVNENSPQLGLENIKKRYEYLTNKKVMVEQNDSSFIVRLPVITEEKLS